MKSWRIGKDVFIEDKKLSEGAFAYVMLCHNANTGQEYALKKILCPDEEAFDIGMREVNVLASFDKHPNIVEYFGHTVVAADDQKRTVALLFEHMKGGHLLDFMERHNGKLQETCVVQRMAEVTSAVSYLHAQTPAIQHRDLKVENILLGTDDQCKLCDFGSCSTDVVDTREADHRTLVALEAEIEKYTTPMYRPPEFADVYQHLKVSERVDCWMLGCILFTLMFYFHPFQDASALAVSNAKYSIPENSVYSTKLTDFVRWFLQLVPEDRPSAEEAYSILDKWDSLEALPEGRNTADKLRKPKKTKRRKEKKRECESSPLPFALADDSFAVFPFPEAQNACADGFADFATVQLTAVPTRSSKSTITQSEPVHSMTHFAEFDEINRAATVPPRADFGIRWPATVSEEDINPKPETFDGETVESYQTEFANHTVSSSSSRPASQQYCTLSSEDVCTSRQHSSLNSEDLQDPSSVQDPKCTPDSISKEAIQTLPIEYFGDGARKTAMGVVTGVFDTPVPSMPVGNIEGTTPRPITVIARKDSDDDKCTKKE